MVTFTETILNRKLHFLCSVNVGKVVDLTPVVLLSRGSSTGIV